MRLGFILTPLVSVHCEQMWALGKLGYQRVAWNSCVWFFLQTWKKGTMWDSDRMGWEEMIVVLSVSDRVFESEGCFCSTFLPLPTPHLFLFFPWCSDYVWDRCSASSHHPPVAFMPPIWCNMSTAMLFLLETVWQTLFVWTVHSVALVNKVVFLSRCQEKWWLPHSAPELCHISFLQGCRGYRCHLIFLSADSEIFAIRLRPNGSLLWKSCR